MKSLKFKEKYQDKIIKILSLLTFQDNYRKNNTGWVNRDDIFDKIEFKYPKKIKNTENFETLESSTTVKEKIKIWQECRQELEDLLYYFLLHKKLDKEQIDRLNIVRLKLAEPLTEFLENEGEIDLLKKGPFHCCPVNILRGNISHL
ncbi:hypothetical protein ACG2F4_19485 [Halalkalibaculum sp. DA3122]|uniref:hypothetical protein n=1 Tax=Halalkalibaculum sp. DA3122 TaxID=3373607 RepID=UPI003754E980